MLYYAEIVARDIQVDADNSDEAESYAKEDVREFYANWNMLVDHVRPATANEELTTEDDDIRFEVEEVQEDDGTYSFDATFELVVEADTPEQAADTAKFFYKTEKYGPREFDAEKGPAAIARILERGEKSEVDGDDAEFMISVAYQALVDIPSADPSHDVLERIHDLEKRWDDYDAEDAKSILAIAAEFVPAEPAAAPTI